LRITNATVMNIIPKAGKGAYLGKTFYTAQVQDPSIGNLKVDFGAQTPPPVGGNISCEVEDLATYGSHKLIRGSLVAPGGFSPTTNIGGAGLVSSGGYAGGRVDFPVPETDKGQSIIRQNSLGHAVALLTRFPDVFFGPEPVKCTEDQLVKKAVEIAFTLSQFSSGALELEVTETLATKLTK
jgi:hypothetical protein